MTALAPAVQALAESAASRPRTLNWRKAKTSLPPPYIARQNRITHLAFAQLGGLEPAMAFLNLFHAALGGKPLDLAGESQLGYTAVSGELLRLAATAPGARA